MFDANDWDGKTKMITTHRSDEMTIIKKLAKLRRMLANQPYTYEIYGCRPMWTPEASAIWNAEYAIICKDHGITNNLLFHWFVDCAREYNQAKDELEALKVVGA